MQLLLLTEDALRETDFPEAYRQPHRFAPTASPPTAPPPGSMAAEPAPGVRATFRLRILFRQNAGWQGTLTWVDGGQERTFRSVLELLLLLDSALETAAA